MDFLTLQKNLEEFGLEIFTLNDIVKITGQKKDVVKSTLTRLIKQKKIFRLKTNYYSLRLIEDKFKFQKLYPGTYISLHSALEFYGSTNQRFTSLDLITNKALKEQKVENTKIQFHQVREELFFGYIKKQISNSTIFISNIEKTLIDCTYFSSKVYLTEIYEFIIKKKEILDKEIVCTYLKKINSSTLNKRVGYLLELNDIHLTSLKINNKYEKLNKNLSKKGIKNAKWKLIVNEDI